MDIGKVIKKLREERGFLTQSALAKACGLSTNTISQIELGKTFPSKLTMSVLCLFLNTTEAYIIVASIDDSDVNDDKLAAFKSLQASLLILLR